MNELVHIGNSDISIKEYKGKRVVTFKDIDMVHGRPDGTARKRFADNRKRFVENEDFFILKPSDLENIELSEKRTLENSVTSNFGTVLITEQGYLMLVKSFTDDLAWDVQRQLVNGYFRTNDTMNRSQLSPQMQMFYAIADGQAKMELEQKRQAEQLNHVEQRVESIREVVALDTTSWREDTGNILRKISMELGGGQAYSQVRTESYELLSKRMGVNLKQRLTNKRRRMADEGICKSARDKLSYVDIIAEDKKLVEGYTAIVKEMAIRYGVGKD